MTKGEAVTLTDAGIVWMASNPKFEERWRGRRGVVEGCGKCGIRVHWEGLKVPSAAIPEKFLRDVNPRGD